MRHDKKIWKEANLLTVDMNIFNDELRLRNNIENMYKKGKIQNFFHISAYGDYYTCEIMI